MENSNQFHQVAETTGSGAEAPVWPAVVQPMKDIESKTAMENPTIPIRYHCRNARLCLQKASFAKKAELATEELQHLRKFESIVMVTLPAHPLYKKADKEVLELEDHLPDTKKRVKEIEEVSYIKSPLQYVHRSGSIAALHKGLHTPEKQQILESRLASIDNAMLLQEPLTDQEQMSKQQEKHSGSRTMSSPTTMPTLPLHLKKSVRRLVPPLGVVSGNGNISKSRAVPHTRNSINKSLADVNNGNANGFSNGKVTEEAVLVSNGSRMNFFESQEQSSSEEESINEEACPPESAYIHFSKQISQGVAGNGNGVHGSEGPALSRNESEDDADSMYSSSTNASMRRAFDSPYDDDTSSQDSQSGDDLLSVDSVFSDKGYEWRWVKLAASETDEVRLIEHAALDENKKGDGSNKQLDALNINSELAAPNNALFATSDAQTGDKAAKSLEEGNVEMYEASTPVSKTIAFPVEWPSIPFCHTVEEQSDYSDSTFEQKFPASPAQTTFSNPVFDFDPLEGNRMSPEVNMLQQLQGNMHAG